MVLVVDTAAQFRQKDFDEMGVEVINYPMFIDGKPVEVSPDMSDEALEEIRITLKDKSKNVATAGLREEDLLAAYMRHPDEPIYSLHMSATASTATAQVITKIIKEHPELDITHFDSRHLVSGYTVLVREAARLVKAGISKEEMDAFRKEAPLRTRHFGVLYDLFYLKRTGRIGTAKAVMGSAMKIIPVLSATDPPGNLKSAGKVKKPSQAIRKFIDSIERDREQWPNAPLKAVVSYVGPHRSECEDLTAAIKEHDSDADVVICGVSNSNLPHVGPDYFDIGYMLMDS